MLKASMFLVGLLCYMQLSAQTKTLKVKDPNLKKTYELFTVLKFNPDVKEGPYQHIIQGKIATEGRYHENRRGGLWTWYNTKGEPECIVNYNTGIVHYPVKNGLMLNWYDEEIVYRQNRSIINLLSDDVAYNVISKNLHYPAYAKDHGIQGEATIGITVNNKGSITQYRIIGSTDTSINTAALNIVKLIPFEFLPAYKNGQAITDEFLFPVRFTLR